ncbi:hypothetical protein HPC49_15830 [Pyxidicoccus fallax]|uniref:Uncharacterized protein n=1 Tax=Pyxidicoccus fallax TaxID=394095 RepID=A0A848L8H0_9BACT|nr:hypothetical protein [Pyxidicoccus fallax]NPC79688.1 hypothetical protein [Pyxidicoccus fallax]
MWLWGCAGTPERGRTDRYGLDSATATCRQTPALCARMAGEETLLPVSRSVQVTASVGTAGSVVLRVLTEVERDRIREALEECADAARSEVILQLLDGKPPTEEKCRDEAEKDAQNQSVSWARKLGTEMHKVARECAQRRLGALRPGGFSLEPRYRFNPETRHWEFLSEETVRSLLSQGRSHELKGTIVPDIVIHTGDPLQALAIYDFKFPCVNPTQLPPWPLYPKGHAHAGQAQDIVYKKALKPQHGPTQIIPRLGATQ